MQITKEMLLKKKDELLERQEQLLGEANATNGALQEIDYWLEVLERPVHTESRGQRLKGSESEAPPLTLKSLQEAIKQGNPKSKVIVEALTSRSPSDSDTGSAQRNS